MYGLDHVKRIEQKFLITTCDGDQFEEWTTETLDELWARAKKMSDPDYIARIEPTTVVRIYR